MSQIKITNAVGVEYTLSAQQAILVVVALCREAIQTTTSDGERRALLYLVAHVGVQ